MASCAHASVATDLTCDAVLEGHTGTIRALAFVSGHVASGSSDRTIRTWDLQRGGLQPDYTHYTTVEGHSEAVFSLVALPSFDGSMRMASGSFDNSVRIWENGREALLLTGHEGTVDSLAALSRRGRAFVLSALRLCAGAVRGADFRWASACGQLSPVDAG